MVYSRTRSGDPVAEAAFAKGAAAAVRRPRPGSAAAAALSSADPLVVLGFDLFFCNVLPRLDASSLAACTAVCSAWRTCCTSDLLWRPLFSGLLAIRAHIPFPLLRSPSSPPPYVAYSITMLDAAKECRLHCSIEIDSVHGSCWEARFLFAQQSHAHKKVELTPQEMCACIWEMKVKPTCGTYWYSLDPTSRGEDPLLRRFQCDGTLSTLQDNDPIWGGQESGWQFVDAKDSKGGQWVQINTWPHHRVIRLPDGRWRLDNYYASYTTCPDQETNMPSYMKGKAVRYCARCNQEPSRKDEECLPQIIPF